VPKNRKGLSLMALVAAFAVAAVWPAQVSAKPSSETAAAKVRILEKRARKSRTIIDFWTNKTRGRWALHLRYDKCWQIHGKQRRLVCRKARQSLRFHTTRYEKVSQVLYELRLETGNEEHWNCIHSFERGAGGWRTSTGNGYYGGLQMDLDFQRAHGLDLFIKKGTADNWTPREQMAVAERAKGGIRTSINERGQVYTWQDRPRGYNPWPNTARMCGLLG